jgi:hypothetical protein
LILLLLLNLIFPAGLIQFILSLCQVEKWNDGDRRN